MEHAAADEAVAKKKSLIASERQRPDVALARDNYFAEQLKDVPLKDVVVLDESYATTQFTRLRGRCPRNQRLIASAARTLEDDHDAGGHHRQWRGGRLFD